MAVHRRVPPAPGWRWRARPPAPRSPPRTYAIKGARVSHRLGSRPSRTATVVIADGKILSVGATAPVPAGAEVIDGTGLEVSPGFFDAMSQLGLTEIGAVNATNDITEVGAYNPQVDAATAVHPATDHIPVARANGITHAVAVPGMLERLWQRRPGDRRTGVGVPPRRLDDRRDADQPLGRHGRELAVGAGTFVRLRHVLACGRARIVKRRRSRPSRRGRSRAGSATRAITVPPSAKGADRVDSQPQARGARALRGRREALAGARRPRARHPRCRRLLRRHAQAEASSSSAPTRRGRSRRCSPRRRCR